MEMEMEMEEFVKPNPSPSSEKISLIPKSVKVKVPEVEIHLFRSGKGPIEVFQSALGGWDQDRLEVCEILEKYGLKSLHAFHPGSKFRGVPIRFNPKNGRSIFPYTPGVSVYLNGEPKDSIVHPITKIVIGVALITLVIAIVARELSPEWLKRSMFNIKNSPLLSPWILTCVVIVFTRARKRTKDFLMKKFNR